MPLSSPLRRAWSSVLIRSRVTDVDAETLRRWLQDLPPPPGYSVSARPLRYRQAPHLAAFCWYDDRRIELQVPAPFAVWDEKVYYRARRRPGKRLRFQWFAKTIRFRTRRDVLRFLYCTSSITGTCGKFGAGRPRRKRPAIGSRWRTFESETPGLIGARNSPATIRCADR